MARINKPVAYRVDIIESKIGWAAKLTNPCISTTKQKLANSARISMLGTL